MFQDHAEHRQRELDNLLRSLKPSKADLPESRPRIEQLLKLGEVTTRGSKRPANGRRRSNSA